MDIARSLIEGREEQYLRHFFEISPTTSMQFLGTISGNTIAASLFWEPEPQAASA
jgi:hypothetical protein